MVYTEAELAKATANREFVNTAAALAATGATAAKLYLIGSEMALRLSFMPIDFVWAVSDLVQDPTNGWNWAGMVPYFGKGIQKIVIAIKDSRGVEKLIQLTEAEVRALAKGESKIVQEGENLAVKDARACSIATTADGGIITEWNEFQRAYKGQGKSSTELAEMWASYKDLTGQIKNLDPLIEAARRKAIAEAWRLERELARKGFGTRRWSTAERAELVATGRVRGYHGHHIFSVRDNPGMASDPRNIEFVTPAEHLRRHGGNWSNPTSGSLIDR